MSAASDERRKICVFTGTRAEYGLLYWLMKEIDADPRLQLQLLVSGSHLASEHGETWRGIEADGFSIDAKVDMKLGSDEPVAVARSMARCLSGSAEALGRLEPDILVVLGDRYEALAAAEAALLLRVPVAHIHGGESTEGAFDDSIRHAITKLSHLHFAAAEPYRQRIIQLGEHPDRVFTTGALGVDGIGRMTLLDRSAIGARLGLKPDDRFLLVTYHPVTLASSDDEAALNAVLDALDQFPAHRVVMTRPNADPGRTRIDDLINRYAAARGDRVRLFASLGQLHYLSAMAACDAVVGNSSSGIIEAPALGRPTVNVGSRQAGRLRGPSIIDCGEQVDAIADAIAQALTPGHQALAAARHSPYGAGGAARRIKDTLALHQLADLVRKPFHDATIRCH